MLEWLSNNSTEIFVGIISGISIIFIVFLLFRPWLYISNKISKADGLYRFKIINLTLSKCTEIDIFLRQVSEVDAFPKGKDAVHDLIALNTKSFIYVSGLIVGLMKRHRPNCLQVKCEDVNLEEIINADNKYLEIIIKARHGMSNLQTTKKRQYKHSKYVMKGQFRSGISCKKAD